MYTCINIENTEDFRQLFKKYFWGFGQECDLKPSIQQSLSRYDSGACHRCETISPAHLTQSHLYKLTKRTIKEQFYNFISQLFQASDIEIQHSQLLSIKRKEK